MKSFIFSLSIFCLGSCLHSQPSDTSALLVGAQQFELYLPFLENKRVAIVANHSSLVDTTHLVDTLLAKKINILKVMAPEHGFRGNKSDGAEISDGKDAKTGLPIVSIYGRTKKPTKEMLEDIDVVVFDIQDVGVRFFTFISTMHYVMEACAENNVQFIVLDRPNPNGMIVDGPILNSEFQSFVGIHPIPTLHGLTVGELAKMINGEGWLENNLKCDLNVVRVKNYNHSLTYELPVKPSPNLPNQKSVVLYPSLALFEGTQVSVGRGTQAPFLQYGHPSFTSEYSFTPVSIPGMSKYPPLEGETCFGKYLGDADIQPGFDLGYLLSAYSEFRDKDNFFKPYFNKLIGNDQTIQQVKDGFSEAQIKATWEAGLKDYKTMRKKYLLYADFE
ncbi:MAG: DUF1343 domain-containing protein [Bacteroidota bacterium]